MVATLVLVFFAIIITIDLLVTRARHKKVPVFAEDKNPPADYPVFSKNSILIPQGFYFSKNHIWAQVEMDGILRIGIDDFLNKVFNKYRLTFRTQEGGKIHKGDKFLEFQIDGKKLSIKSPIEGTVTAINHAVLENSSLIRQNPYEEGWLLRIEPAELKYNLNSLNIGKDIVKWMKGELVRLKEFLGKVEPQPNLVGVTMYDGGNIVEGVITYLDEKNLENFENEFLTP